MLELFLKAQVVAGAMQDAQGGSRRLADLGGYGGVSGSLVESACVAWANCTCPLSMGDQAAAGASSFALPDDGSSWGAAWR